MQINPIIIIGSPRSGTNMLRDTLTYERGMCTWPCDEINYIWRYGNAYVSHDEFDKSMITNKNKKYIRKRFYNISKCYNSDYVVEKTCANSLRVDYVDGIMPEAKYIYIYRDGRDVIASELKRWKAELDLNYIINKSIYIPVRDIPFYAIRYAYHRLFKLFSKEKRLSTWGPRFKNIDQYLEDHSLVETCAMQWMKCVENASSYFETIDQKRVYRLRYEDFVNSPKSYLSEIFSFIGIKINPNLIENMCESITNNNIGKWKNELSDDQLNLIETILYESLQKLGYNE